jgi:Cellulase (glycosyl hydrolase family 5)
MWGARALAATVGTLSIAIAGNHFVNASGQTVRLLGVDHSGTEYACEQGWGYSNGVDSPADAAADAAAIAAWHANAVRIPLNEDCWLGINGEPAYGSQSGYQQTVENYVAALNADGIYAILDLHWSAPSSVVADGQRPMADADHSVDFWQSVAAAFESNPAVVFDAFNEPYSPAANYAGAASLTWSCWENGGCSLPSAVDGTNPAGSSTYTAAGMQQLVTAIRSTGATQPILLGGLAYSNDLTGWLAYEPTDPDNQLAASVHIYEGNACGDTSCWGSQVASVAAKVPVVIGEFGQNPTSSCAATDDQFDNTLMNWADQSGVSYLAWGWYDGASPDCSDYWLDDASGNPVAPNGTALQAHLATLAASDVGGVIGTSASGSQTGGGGSSTTPTTTPSGGSTATPSGGSTTTPSGGSTTTKPLRCVVPKLIGDTLTRARTLLRRAHCAVGKVSYRKRKGRLSAAAKRKPAVVIKATPARGRKLAAGAKVRLLLERH